MENKNFYISPEFLSIKARLFKLIVFIVLFAVSIPLIYGYLISSNKPYFNNKSIFILVNLLYLLIIIVLGISLFLYCFELYRRVLLSKLNKPDLTIDKDGITVNVIEKYSITKKELKYGWNEITGVDVKPTLNKYVPIGLSRYFYNKSIIEAQKYIKIFFKNEPTDILIPPQQGIEQSDLIMLISKYIKEQNNLSEEDYAYLKTQSLKKDLNLQEQQTNKLLLFVLSLCILAAFIFCAIVIISTRYN